ncbi:MAG: IS1634 family transposase, partial [Candidatus Saccharimonadales bacterium]
PIACHLYDGNRNGHTGIKEQYFLLRQFLQLPDNLLLVSDRGTCSAEHLATLRSHGHFGLCAGQWQDYQPLYEQHAEQLNWQPASYLSLEQQRRRQCNSSLPLEEYRLAVVHHQLIDPTTKTPFDCRVIFVHSSAAAKESKLRREKNIAKIRAGLDTIARKLEKAHTSTTLESVARQITRLLGKKSAASFFRWEIVPLSAEEKAALPQPARGHRGQTHRLVYSFDQAAAADDASHDGIYALVTTAPLTWSGDALLTEYKRQTYIERENHELKTPIAVTPIFLKTPSRVEALVSLLFLALQAYMTLERLYRQTVPADAKPAQRRMTAEKLLKKFDVCCLIVEQQPYGELIHVTRLSREQRSIITQLS